VRRRACLPLHDLERRANRGTVALVDDHEASRYWRTQEGVAIDVPRHANAEHVRDCGQYVDGASGSRVDRSFALARVLDEQRDPRDVSKVRVIYLPLPFTCPKPSSMIRHDHDERAVIEANTKEQAEKSSDQRVRIPDLQ